MNARATEIRGETWSVLKERVKPKLWILLPGDDPQALNSTVGALTQGLKSKVDIDLLMEFVDDTTNDSLYASEWRKRRGQMAHLFRALDVRLYGLPPNVALAAVRSKGEALVRERLTVGNVALATAQKTLRNSRLYKDILQEFSISVDPYVGGGNIKPETINEYRRVQVQAKDNDKPLNKALGSLILSCLENDVPDAVVTSEKRSVGNTPIRPDIAIRAGEVDYICIEPTWRSTGTGIDGEIKNRQNTLAPAYLKKYIMDKTLEYVKALGL